MIDLFRNLFSSFRRPAEPLTPTNRVNHTVAGHVIQADGVVVALGRYGSALVEWPTGGAQWLPRSELSLIMDDTYAI